MLPLSCIILWPHLVIDETDNTELQQPAQLQTHQHSPQMTLTDLDGVYDQPQNNLSETTIKLINYKLISSSGVWQFLWETALFFSRL